MKQKGKRAGLTVLLLCALLCALLAGFTSRLNARAVRETGARGKIALSGAAPIAVDVPGGEGETLLSLDLLGEPGERYELCVYAMTGIKAFTQDGAALSGLRPGLPLAGAAVEFTMPRDGTHLEVRLNLPAGGQRVLLGTPRAISRLTLLRVLCYASLLCYVLAMGLFVILSYLFERGAAEQLALAMVYLLLALTQAGEIFHQYVGAQVAASAAQALLCAALCCYAGVSLGDGRESRAVLAALALAGGLTVTMLALFFTTGRFFLSGLSDLLAVAFSAYALAIALRGVRRGARAHATLHCLSILPLIVGVLMTLFAAPDTLVLPPMLLMGAMMTFVQQVTIGRDQADNRRQREALERELERRVKERTEALERTGEQLARIDKSRAEFFSRIAHDLQSPLTIIRGSLDLVAGGVPVTDEERDAYLEMAKQNALRMTNRVKALRGLALLDETPFSPRVAELQPVLTQCVRGFSGVYKKSQIVFTAECEPGLCARFDAGWLQNALERLVSNAVRYTPVGGSVTVAAQRVPFGVNVSVRDTGCGIALDEQEGIFDRFYQGWNSPEGFGIGLAVVQRVAQRHGGRAQVQSVPGEGATFTIYLPDERAGE